MKVKALDSFCAAEVGMIHAGQTFDASDVSEERLKEWDQRGLIAEADAEEPASLEPTAKGKAASKKTEG